MKGKYAISCSQNSLLVLLLHSWVRLRVTFFPFLSRKETVGTVTKMTFFCNCIFECASLSDNDVIAM
jgi:hypothetical protein